MGERPTQITVTLMKQAKICSLTSLSMRLSYTWFVKNEVNKRTWQHPHFKRWHCIDYKVITKDAWIQLLSVVLSEIVICSE